MTMADKNNVDRQLLGMSDEEAIAVLEGRLPAADPTEVHLAAKAIAEGLQNESDEDESDREHGGGAPSPAAPGQPWLKMVATFALGVMLSSAVVLPTLGPDRSSSSATANVVFLDNYRSSTAADLLTISAGEPGALVSLVAYPDFTGAETLTIHLEQSPTPGRVPDAAAPWRLLLVETMSVGTRDSVVVTVPGELLGRGVHRLRMSSEAGAAGTVLFNVED